MLILLSALLGDAPARPRAPADSVVIQFDVRVPMRDGVTLAADVYRPTEPGRHPVILTRTPYNKVSDGLLKQARAFVGRGYVFVAMDVRGRGNSDGEWVPYRHDGDDGYDAIEWCAAQPWSTGKIGTIGGSYVGLNQWLAAVRRPPHLATMIVLAPPTDPFGDVWLAGPGGLPTPTMISWYHLTAGHVLQNMNAVDWERLNWHLPLLTMDEAAGRPNPLWRDLIQHARLDEWWAPLQYQTRLEQVSVPVMHVSGWYDDTQRATPMNFSGMRAKAATRDARDHQMMVIGPWPHGINSKPSSWRIDLGPDAIIDLAGLQTRWFDRWLKGEATPAGKRVRLFAMQTNRWFEVDDWPIPGTELTKYYLTSGGHANTSAGDGRLEREPPPNAPTDRYRYDPATPKPFLTEPSFAQLGGPDDYGEVERRPDVLVYTGAAFTGPTLVCGPLSASLAAASSARDTDFMVMVLDLWPDGFVQRLNDGMVRARFRNGPRSPELIEPNRVYRYELDLWNTCQTFLPGHRLRVQVTSAEFPKFDRNPNTGDPLGMNAKLEVASQTIYHDREHPSYVVIPIVPNAPGIP